MPGVGLLIADGGPVDDEADTGVAEELAAAEAEDAEVEWWVWLGVAAGLSMPPPPPPPPVFI